MSGTRKLEDPHFFPNKPSKIRREIAQACGLSSDLSNFFLGESEAKKFLEGIFQSYDAKVFRGQLSKKIQETGSEVIFSNEPGSEDFGACSIATLSTLEESKQYNLYTFSFDFDLYFSLFPPGDKTRALRVNGLLCTSRLEVLLVVFEHEICHLIMMLWGYDDKSPSPSLPVPRNPNFLRGLYSSHGTIFSHLVRIYFSHTDVKHRLFFGDALEKHLSPRDVLVGEEIYYVEPKHPSGTACERKRGRVRKIRPCYLTVENEEGLIELRWELTRKNGY